MADQETPAAPSTPPRRVRPFGKVHPLTLPSGNKVKARRAPSFSLVASGGLPAELTSFVWKLFGGKAQFDEIMENTNGLKDYTMLLARYLPYVLVSPRLVNGEAATTCEPDAEGILRGDLNLADVPDLDQNHLFLFGIGVQPADDEPQEEKEAEAAGLRTFPGEPAGAGAGPSGETVRDEAVGVPGNAA